MSKLCITSDMEKGYEALKKIYNAALSLTEEDIANFPHVKTDPGRKQVQELRQRYENRYTDGNNLC